MVIKKSNGNVLGQYGIIIALIALAVIPVFFIFGKTIVENFTSFQGYLSESEVNNSGYGSSTTSTNPNTGNGSSSATCENGTCTLISSEGVSLNIPENMSEFIETAGSSGGVGEFAKILDQLIAQMDSNDDSLCNSADKSLCTADLKRFSDLIKLQADNYKFIEDLAKKGTKEDFENAQYSSFNDLGYQPAEGLENVLPNADYDYYIVSLLNERNHIGWSSKVNNPGTDGSSDRCLGSAIMDQYDVIIESSNYSDTTKKAVKEILSGLSQTSTNMEALTQAALSSHNKGSSRSIDPFTGQEIEIKSVEISDLTELTNPSQEIEFNLQELFQ